MPFKPSALRRKTPLKRAGRLRPMSPKRRRELPIRADVRLVVLERDFLCRGRVTTECTPERPLKAAHVHEVLPRSRGGDWLNPEDCIGVCAYCHAWIHAHPKLAKTLGLLR